MNKTQNFEFNLPSGSDYYNVEDFNENFRKIDQEIKPADAQLDETSTNPVQNKAVAEAVDAINDDLVSLGESVADGKALIASAITSKGVNTAVDTTFDIMADNINIACSNRYLMKSQSISWSTTTISGISNQVVGTYTCPGNIVAWGIQAPNYTNQAPDAFGGIGLSYSVDGNVLTIRRSSTNHLSVLSGTLHLIYTG